MGYVLIFQDPAVNLNFMFFSDNRFVFVKLYKEHGSAVADYRNNQYESEFLPGIRVAKGIYRLNVRDNGISKSVSKEIIDSSELRTMFQTIAK